MFSQLSSTIIASVSLFFVARLLGSTNYGHVTIALIPTSIAALFLDPGVDGALVKYLAQYRSEKNITDARSILISGLTIKIITSIILTIIIYSLSGYIALQIFNQPKIKLLIQITSLNLIAQSMINTSKSIFVGYERMELVSIIVIIQSLLNSFIVPILVYIGYGTLGSVSGYTTSLIIAGVVGLILVWMNFMKRVHADEKPKIDFYGTSRTILIYGAPLFLSILLGGSILNINKFLLAIHVNPFDIGNYQAASNFTVLITFFTIPISTVLFPLFSKISPGESGKLAAVYKNAVKYSALITVPISTGIILLSNPLTHIIYGNTYSRTPHYLKWVCIPFLFIGIGSWINGNLLKGQGKTRSIFMSNILTVIVGLPVSLYLIPKIGVMGLLISFIIAPLAGHLYKIFNIKRIFGFSLELNTTIKIYLSAAIAFTLSFILLLQTAFPEWIQLIFGGITFTITYVIMIFILKILTIEDLWNLRLMLSSMGPLSPIFNIFLSLFEKLIT